MATQEHDVPKEKLTAREELGNIVKDANREDTFGPFCSSYLIAALAIVETLETLRDELHDIRDEVRAVRLLAQKRL